MTRRPRGVDSKRVTKRWRCTVCGEMCILIGRCPVHPEARRVEWTATLNAAYRAQLGRLERGEEPEKHAGLLGNTYELAARYAREWRAAKTEDVRGEA